MGCWEVWRQQPQATGTAVLGVRMRVALIITRTVWLGNFATLRSGLEFEQNNWLAVRQNLLMQRCGKIGVLTAHQTQILFKQLPPSHKKVGVWANSKLWADQNLRFWGSRCQRSGSLSWQEPSGSKQWEAVMRVSFIRECV